MVIHLAVVIAALLSGPVVAADTERVPPHASSLEAALDAVAEDAAELDPLRTLIVAHKGRTVIEQGYRGISVTRPANIKSASKSIMSALVGIAIDRGLLDGPDQLIAPLLEDHLPENPDPRIHDITIGNLLSMQAGLGRTSGANYGRWISSPNWVRAALAEPFIDEPGGGMLYSTCSTHLLSAILTRISGHSTLELARRWLGPVEDLSIAAWERDPQGIHIGGNEVSMSPRALLAFGELYRRGGQTPDGTQVVSRDWIAESWRQRTRSRFTGDGYGYGWFMRRIGGRDVYYGWGYGGQMLYIVPALDLTVVMTSDTDAPAGRTGYRDQLHRLVERVVGIVADAEGDRGVERRS